MQNILVVVLFVAALAYVVVKISRSISSKGCQKGCGGSCSTIPQNNS